MSAPTTSSEFDRAYRQPITFWGDIRIPAEIKALVQSGSPRRALELGCGIGRFSRYVAKMGVQMTGIDFSPVAISKARENATDDNIAPTFLVGDVTHLDGITGPFDMSFDVGCFHCLGVEARRAYVAEVFRLLAPGGTHLLWALDTPPSDIAFSAAIVEETFAPGFRLQQARASRRRIVRSHWYWLVRS